MCNCRSKKIPKPKEVPPSPYFLYKVRQYESLGRITEQEAESLNKMLRSPDQENRDLAVAILKKKGPEKRTVKIS